MKLATKIVLLCLLSMAVMTSLFSYITIQRDTEYFEEEHARSAAELAGAIESLMLSDWRSGDSREVAEMVRACSVGFRQFRIRYVRPGSPETSNGPVTTRNMLEGLEEERFTVIESDDYGVQTVYTYVPLDVSGASGMLEVSRPMQNAKSRMHDTLWKSLLSLAGMSILCIGVVVFSGIHMIGRPLDRLVEKTKRIGEGDFSGPVQFDDDTELNQLAAALNTMCEHLEEQREQIRREAESRASAEDQLRHADRLNTVGRLAAGIAHEVGTPLNVVSGRAGLIASGKLDADAIRSSAITIKEESERITKIVRDLLDFARRGTPQRSAEDVADMLRPTISLLQPLASKQDVVLQLDCASGVPRASVDSAQLQQVVTNLIMNSVHSISGSGRVDVHVSHELDPRRPDHIEDRGSWVRIDVRDTGRGISAEEQKHIFEPFFTTKDVGQGTGLGLSIAYSIVRDHDGWIEVASEPGRGSCFSVFLPATASTAQPARREADLPSR